MFDLDTLSGELGRIGDRAQAIHRKHMEHEAALKNVSSDVDDLISALDDVDGAYDDINEGVDEVNEGLDETESGLDDVSEGLDDDESSLGAFGDKSKKKKAKKAADKAKSGKNKAKTGTSKAKAGTVKAKSKTATAKKSAVKTKDKVEKVKDTSSELKTEIDKQSKDIAEIKTRIESAEFKKGLSAAIENKDAVTRQTVISTIFSLINAGAAAAVATFNVQVPKDTYVESIKMRASPAVGAAATSLGCIVSQIQLAQDINILTGFSNNNAAVTNATGATTAIQQGKQVLISDIAPTAVPVNQTVKSNEGIAFSLVNISAVAADGVRLNIDVITRSAATQTIMTL